LVCDDPKNAFLDERRREKDFFKLRDPQKLMICLMKFEGDKTRMKSIKSFINYLKESSQFNKQK
jgi:hypothetical protein